MKNIWKTVPALAVAVLVFAACAPDEKLDLAGYPETTMGLNISDLKPEAPLLELTAVYDSEGKLVLDGEVSHNYILRLDTSNSQDMKLRVEPIIENIPTDKVTISETQLTLPAGEIEAPVTVTFTDEDFNFAAPNKDAETYEIGVRLVDVQGYNTVAELGSEAKVVINKERYEARVSLADEEGREVAFNRVYWDGTIYNETPMSYDFKVYLDKAATSDVTVTFSMEGLAAEFADDWSVTPSSVVIPAGSLVSESLTWTCSDDFLLTTDEGESHTLALKAAYTSTDAYTALNDGKDAIRFNVVKVLDAMEILSSKPATWTRLSPTGWQTNAADLFNNSTSDYTYVSVSVVTVDMLEVKTLAGFSIVPYMNSATYNIRDVEVAISDDGVTYSPIGVKQSATRVSPLVIGMKGPVSARYLRMTLGSSSIAGYLAEFEVYGSNQ